MIRRIHIALRRLQASATVINFLAAAFLVCCANGPFWTAFINKIGGLATANHLAFVLMTGLSLCLVFNILFSFFSFSAVHKPFLVVVFCTAAVASYFMGSYGIVIDQKMITNLLETDVREASEQLTWPLFRHFLLLGVLPSTLLLVTRVTYQPWRSELLVRSGVMMGSAVLLVAIVWLRMRSVSHRSYSASTSATHHRPAMI